MNSRRQFLSSALALFAAPSLTPFAAAQEQQRHANRKELKSAINVAILAAGGASNMNAFLCLSALQRAIAEGRDEELAIKTAAISKEMFGEIDAQGSNSNGH